MLQRKNQSGRTMVEMLAVLAVIGVLTVGAIAGLSQAMDKYRLSKTHDDILSINQSIVDLYAWSRRYPDMSAAKMQEMCKNDVFPDGCISGSVAKNVYGGAYEIMTSSTDSVVTITLTNLPSNACTDLASDEMDWGEYLVDDGEHKNPTCNNGVFTIKFY